MFEENQTPCHSIESYLLIKMVLFADVTHVASAAIIATGVAITTAFASNGAATSISAAAATIPVLEVVVFETRMFKIHF